MFRWRNQLWSYTINFYLNKWLPKHLSYPNNCLPIVHTRAKGPRTSVPLTNVTKTRVGAQCKHNNLYHIIVAHPMISYPQLHLNFEFAFSLYVVLIFLSISFIRNYLVELELRQPILSRVFLPSMFNKIRDVWKSQKFWDTLYYYTIIFLRHPVLLYYHILGTSCVTGYSELYERFFFGGNYICSI